MRTIIANAALLVGLVLWTAPAFANGEPLVVADKPIVTAEKDVPAGPRICLFSQNGKRAESVHSDSANEVEQRRDHAAQQTHEEAYREAAAPHNLQVAPRPSKNDASSVPSEQQATDRVCGTDATLQVTPHA